MAEKELAEVTNDLEVSEEKLAEVQQEWASAERRYRREIDGVTEERDTLANQVQRNTWTIEANQLAEGSREFFGWAN